MDRKAGRVKDGAREGGRGENETAPSVLCSFLPDEIGRGHRVLAMKGSPPQQLGTSALGSRAGGPGECTDRET